MDMKEKCRAVLLCLAVLAMIAFSPALSTAAEVYLEGAYDAQYLDVYIYANFSEPQVISYGVRLNYLPAELAVVSASKLSNLPPGDPTPYTSNQTVWQLGTGPNKDNPAPDFTTSPGAVVFIGGILDESAPTAGVVNTTKVFLGTVRFGPGTGGVIPAQPTLSLTYAKGNGNDPYKNFVQYVAGGPSGGVVLDGTVIFRTVNVTTTPRDIARRGDANADGSINSGDINTLRALLMFGGAYKVSADCNKDGTLSSGDFNCLRAKLLP